MLGGQGGRACLAVTQGGVLVLQAGYCVTLGENAGGRCIIIGVRGMRGAATRHLARLVARSSLAWGVLMEEVRRCTMHTRASKSRWSRWRGSELASVARLRGRLESELRGRLLQALDAGQLGEAVQVAVAALRAVKHG